MDKYLKHHMKREKSDYSESLSEMQLHKLAHIELINLNAEMLYSTLIIGSCMTLQNNITQLIGLKEAKSSFELQVHWH